MNAKLIMLTNPILVSYDTLKEGELCYHHSKGFGKTDREVIRKEIESLMNMIKSSIPFYQEQFVEATEKTLVEAKSEFEAWVEGQIRSKGLQALADEIKSQMPLIENPIKD